MLRIAKILFITMFLVLLAGIPTFAANTDLDLNVTATVTKAPGNTNILTITIADQEGGAFTEEFSIRNNAKGSYKVGAYGVFVSTYGNDKIDQCYIESIDIVDLDTVDLTQPYSKAFSFIDKDGPAIIEVEYIPAPLTRGPGTATVGTHKTSYTGVVFN
ncbi:MAG: hypothetical protein FWG14_10095 [Peptococcaceae bacterium]|nr:hypothetical protein [Peptococcaceae bacterium]